ncbi:MAG TPA: flagellar basal body rod protein FlgC [Vitreimonas sp.]|uniref:flagellar basal body rod protein FlgC n=1 Tax=Vitreimonas sp. TaxID=3069702 RepID=UPI002D748FE8|nr:flagellar basal body rod protein FlgC [Vitreimonas sp.]HYD85985.1 flagellar basal body rod protein FlgC [Vitreimonas sp.]
MNAVEISKSALDVEWRRLEISAQNLANLNTTRTADGGVYLPQRLLSGPALSFSAMLEAGVQLTPRGVEVLGVEAIGEPARRSFEPGHPHADEHGFVSYPAIDHSAEMTLMIRASRAYEANLAAISIAQDMYARALDIGRQS